MRHVVYRLVWTWTGKPTLVRGPDVARFKDLDEAHEYAQWRSMTTSKNYHVRTIKSYRRPTRKEAQQHAADVGRLIDQERNQEGNL